MNPAHTTYKNLATESLCAYCASDKIRFVDFGKANKRLNDKQIAVTEIWICRNCGKEFERVGTLYSPEDVNRVRLRVALLSWAGYIGGSILTYVLYFGNLG